MRGHQFPNLPSLLYRNLESTENIRCAHHGATDTIAKIDVVGYLFGFRLICYTHQRMESLEAIYLIVSVDMVDGDCCRVNHVLLPLCFWHKINRNFHLVQGKEYF